MKRWFFVIAVVFGVAVCHAEMQRRSVSREGNASKSVPHSDQEHKREDSKRGRTSLLSSGDWFGGRKGEPEYKELALSEEAPPNTRPSQTPQESVESLYLKEIAVSLSISVSENDTPGDIAFKIKQRIDNVNRYRGEVLSDSSFEKAKSAIRIPSDAEVFSEYHKFIKKIAVKKIIVIEEVKEP